MSDTNETLSTLFDSLKCGELVTLSFSSCMGGQHRNITLKVGRRSRSKKWGTTTLTFERRDGVKVSPMNKLKLIKRRSGAITFAIGDMGGKLITIKRG